MVKIARIALCSQVFLWIFLLFYNGRAQITITSNDIPSTIGTSFFQYMVDDTTDAGMPADVGFAGATQNWSFSQSQYPNGGVVEIKVVDPATTPFADSFAMIDFAWNLIHPFEPINFIEYFKLTATEFLLEGMGVVEADTQYAEVITPAQRLALFPLTFNTAWKQFYADTGSVDSGGITFTVINTLLIEDSVDAWGTITVPLGNFPCLRIREDQTRVFTYILNGWPFYSYTLRSISYTWMGENVGFLATVESKLNEMNPNFTTAKQVAFRVPNPTHINENEIVVKQFCLLDNYPNPFNPETKIEYYLPQPSEVEISIFNLQGQKVATLIRDYLTVGSHKIIWNGTDETGQTVASGVYLYQLKVGSFLAVKKMLLLR